MNGKMATADTSWNTITDIIIIIITEKKINQKIIIIIINLK